MTHLNKSIDSDARGVDNFIKDLRNKENKDKKDSIENYLLLFLLLFALGGITYHFQYVTKDKDAFSQIGIGYSYDNTTSPISETRTTTLSDQEPQKAEVLSIKGLKETYEEITFIIKGFDPNAIYILDFGDGVERRIESSQVTYRYPRAGFYEVNLLLKYGGKVKELFSDELNIAEAPEIFMEEFVDVEY